jgi:hypothetical protein
VTLGRLRGRRSSLAAGLLAAVVCSTSYHAQEIECLVVEDGKVCRFDPSAPVASSGSHAWQWSRNLPPRKVSVADCSPDRAKGLAKKDATERLTVHLAAAPDERDAPMQVIAAPQEMWEEVPETLLPHYPVAADTETVRIPVDAATPWRLRAIGERRGSWWLDVRPGASRALLTPHEASDVVWQVIGTDGAPLADTRLSVLATGPGPNEVRKLADFRTDDQGRARLRVLPDERPVQALASHDDHAPTIFGGFPAELAAAPWRLEPGSKVRGRFLSAEHLPQHGVRVRARGWLADDLPLPLVKWAVTGADGRWEIGALPRRRIELLAEADGHLPKIEVLDLEHADLDLGDLTLPQAAVIEVRVVDDLGVPLPGARLTTDRRTSPATTDEEGRGWLDVAADRPFDLTVEAVHHLPATRRLRPPFAERQEMVVDRGFVIRGRFVDSAGAPVGDGTGHLWRETRMQELDVQPDGSFEATLPPDEPLRLELASPRTATLTREVLPGARGEQRDLGELAAPPGLTVAGLLLRSDTAEPVAGARVWLPRPSDKGPLVAWMLEDLLETRSGADGRFELTGAPLVPLVLRIEAPGLARRTLTAIPEPGDRRLELGELELGPGATVIVKLVEDEASEGPERPGEPASATLDLGGQRLPADQVGAPVVDGVAHIPRVPPGEVTITVSRGSAVLCEETVEVSDSEDRVSVTCRSRRLQVAGEVRVGGRPAGPGILSWTPPSAAAMPEGILSYGTGALKRSRIFSASSPATTVEVDEDGRFASGELRPGRWEVLWHPASGPSAGPRPVEIPDTERHTLSLEFPGLALSGVVVDTDGAPVSRARVRLVSGEAFTVADDEGTFTLGGLEPGVHLVQARTSTTSSAPLEIRVEPDHPPDPVELVIAEREPDLRLLVTLDGVPAAGALVFLEEEGRPLRILTAAGDGRLAVELQSPASARVRTAVHAGGHWHLGGWRPRSAAGESDDEELAVSSERGSLAIVAAEAAGRPQILTADGWDFSALLSWLGSPPRLSPTSPLTVGGLPTGTYTVALGDRREAATVEAGEIVTIELD